MSGPAKWVLVVENDPDLLRAVTLRLRIAGYQVIAAADVDAARRALQTQIIHLAIIDIRATDDRSESDTSGFALARTLPPYIPFLFHTAHDTKEYIRLALGEIGADDIIAKEDPAAPAKLVACVHAMFAQRVGVNFALELTSTVDLAEVVAASVRTLPASAIPPTSEDLEMIIRRLFPQALAVALTPLLPPETAQSYSGSGAVLLRVHETRADGEPVPVVLKVGPTTLITEEADRYAAIRPYLGTQRLARLEGVAHSRQLGGLLYTLVNAQEWTLINSLASRIQSKDTVTLQQLLQRFLQQTFAQIQQTTQPARLSLMDEYTTKLNLTVSKLRNAVEAWQPTLLHTPVLPIDTGPPPLQPGDMGRRGRPVSYAGCGRKLHRPLSWRSTQPQCAGRQRGRLLADRLWPRRAQPPAARLCRVGDRSAAQVGAGSTGCRAAGL
jgi:CheY-like chemotaxis protein